MTPRLSACARGAIRAAVTCALLASTAAAQVLAGDPMLDRSKRPVPPPAAPYKFPKVQPRALSNGISVAIVENHDLPVVAVRVVIDAGSRLDPAGKEGMYDLMTAMLREGTTTMTADELAESFADLGSQVTPTAFTTTPRNVDRSLELMSDLLINPSFPQAALDRQRATMVANLSRSKDQPAFVANRIMSSVLYGEGHPYARVATDQSLSGIVRDDLVRFHSQFIRPENVKLVVAGDVSPVAILAKLEKTFGKWEKGGSKAPSVVAAPRGVSETKIYLYDRPNSPQSNVVVAQLGPTRTVSDFFALEAMSTIYGDLSGSRIFQNLREKHAFAYNARSTIVWRRAPEASTFLGISDVGTPKTDSALTLWLQEMRDIRGTRPPTDSEMVFARTNRVAGLPARMESIDAIATRVASVVQDNLPYDFYERYIAGISKLNASEVAAAAKKYVDPSHLAIVIVGDRKQIEPGLKAANIAPVVVVDENGRPVP